MANGTGKTASQAEKQPQSGLLMINSHRNGSSSDLLAETEKEPLNVVSRVFAHMLT
jgi:hypothetical protein